MDTYVRRTTRAFSFVWSAFALCVATVGILLGAVTDPAPDYFIILLGVSSGLTGGVCGFLHGVTLSAARNLDAAHKAELAKQRESMPPCYEEYCGGDDVCPNQH